MADFVGCDEVVVSFPFTDLQSSRRRTAVVLATFARGDLLMCKITRWAGFMLGGAIGRARSR